MIQASRRVMWPPVDGGPQQLHHLGPGGRGRRDEKLGLGVGPLAQSRLKGPPPSPLPPEVVAQAHEDGSGSGARPDEDLKSAGDEIGVGVVTVDVVAVDPVEADKARPHDAQGGELGNLIGPGQAAQGGE